MKTRCMLFAVAASAAIGLTGCAAMTDTMSAAAGMGVVRQEHSTFDNATVITVSPMPLWAKGSWGNAVQLGAHWSSASPDYVALEMSYRSNVNAGSNMYTDLSGMDINVDGEITHWQTGAPTQLSSSNYNAVSHTIYTGSNNSVVIPYALLQRMVAAKDCRLRIHTDEGYEDAQFNIERIPGGQATAIHSIRKFMAQVDATRSGNMKPKD
jgi:hypothetical protein